MRFTIDLATNRILDHRRVNRICAVIGAVLLGFLCWNTCRISWNTGESHRLDDDITALERELKSRPAAVVDTDSAATRARIRFFNEILARKAFGWLDLLERIELATLDGIALSGLAPDRKNGTVTIEGWARDFGKVRSYLESLDESIFFDAVQLVSHKEVVLWEQARGIQFSIVCRVKTL